jgi:tetratricopeptide (TPR) repeat protein
VEDASTSAARKLSAATAGKTGDELYNQKLYAEALAKYLENYTEGSQSLDDRIAETYKRTGNIDQAIKFFQKNLSIPGEYADKAAVEIAKLYTDKKDRQGFDKYMNQISGIDADIAGKYVTLIAKYLDKNGENASGIKIVSDFMATHPRARNADEFFFLLGNFYEKDTQLRDLKKSWMYYRKVCDEFPESMFLDASLARITYLNRYFFIIK